MEEVVDLMADLQVYTSRRTPSGPPNDILADPLTHLQVDIETLTLAL